MYDVCVLLISIVTSFCLKPHMLHRLPPSCFKDLRGYPCLIRVVRWHLAVGPENTSNQHHPNPLLLKPGILHATPGITEKMIDMSLIAFDLIPPGSGRW